MIKFIKILLLVLACTISWYCGELSQPSPISKPRTTVEVKTYDYNTTTPQIAPKEGDSVVYVTKGGDERYHQLDCPRLKRIYMTTPKGAEDANYKYCYYCNPPKE